MAGACQKYIYQNQKQLDLKKKYVVINFVILLYGCKTQWSTCESIVELIDNNILFLNFI